MVALRYVGFVNGVKLCEVFGSDKVCVLLIVLSCVRFLVVLWYVCFVNGVMLCEAF